jgi:two-component system, NarL family, sensor histidine kinase UhpB
MNPIRILFLIALILFSPGARAQVKTQVDSLNTLIKEHKADTSLVNIYLRLSKIYTDISDNANSRKYAESGLKMALKINFTEGIGGSKERLGVLALNTGNYEAAFIFLSEALLVNKNLKKYSREASLLNELALLLYYKGNYDSAMVYCNEAYTAAEIAKDSSLLDDIFNMKGCIYQKKGDFDLAADFLFKALNLAERSHDSLNLAMIIGNIGLVNSDLGKQEIARNYHFDALKRRIRNGQLRETAMTYQQLGVCYKRMRLLDSALHYYQLGLPISLSIDDNRATAYLLHNISDVYKTQNNFDSAAHYSQLANAKFEAMNDHLGMIVTLNNRGQIFLRMAEEKKDKRYYKDALKYLNESLKVAASIRAKDWMLKDYDWISVAYEAMGDNKKALDNLKLYATMVDTVYAESKTKQIAEMQTKYESEKKDREIAENKVQMAQNEIDLTKKSNANRMLLAGIGGLVLLVVFGSISFTQRQKLQNRKKEIEKQKALEQTRAAIARDLHDDLGATLSSVQIMSSFASTAIEKNAPDAKLWVQRIGDNTGDILQNIRDIVWTMNPENDKAEELILRMKQFASQTLEPKNIRYGFTIDENVAAYLNTLPAKRNAFLIYKEAVNNAVKYSACSEMKISFEMNGKKSVLKITDNGKGFNTSSAAVGNGLGNMNKRALELSGSLTIDSSSEAGTCVTLFC